MSNLCAFKTIPLNEATVCYLRVEFVSSSQNKMLRLSFENCQTGSSGPASVICVPGITREALRNLGEQILDAANKM